MSLKERRKALIISLILGFIIIGAVFHIVFSIGKTNANETTTITFPYEKKDGEGKKECRKCKEIEAEIYVLYKNCTYDGMLIERCTKCFFEYMDGSDDGSNELPILVAPLGHNVNWVNNGETHSGNCTNGDCDYEITEEPHNYIEGICLCGAIEGICEHNMGEWSIDTEDAEKHTRECSKCGHKETENHTRDESAIPTKTEETEEGHKATYECSKCTEEIVENHETKWEIDDNKNTHTGICEVSNCGYTKENEEHKWTIITGEGMDASGHLRECDICKYRQQASHNNEIVDNGNTHSLKCMDNCGYEEEHETRWIPNENEDGTHTGTCDTEQGCNFNKTESHTMGEWAIDTEDDKKHSSTCKCGYKEIKDHKKGEVTYEDTEEGHKVIYACSVEGCTGKITENHETKWVATEDRNAHTGTCEETDCGYEKEAQSHSGGTHENNGLCEKCDIVYQTHGKTGNPTYEKTTDGHKAVYECSFEGCSGKIKDDEESHSISSWNDNKDGKHSGICSVCKYTVTEVHTNGTTSDCTKCEFTVNNAEDDEEDDNNGSTEEEDKEDNENDNNEDTNNDNENNNDGNMNEGDEDTGNNNNEGTNGGNSNNGNNNNGNGNNGGTTNNNSGIKDETQATSPIPQTGVNSIIIISSIVALIGLAVTMTIKLKGYKDVE